MTERNLVKMKVGCRAAYLLIGFNLFLFIMFVPQNITGLHLGLVLQQIQMLTVIN